MYIYIYIYNYIHIYTLNAFLDVCLAAGYWWAAGDKWRLPVGGRLRPAAATDQQAGGWGGRGEFSFLCTMMAEYANLWRRGVTPAPSCLWRLGSFRH